jgi:hypothetical protein
MAGLSAELTAIAFGLGRDAVPPTGCRWRAFRPRIEDYTPLHDDEYTPYTTPSRTADTKHKTSRVIM